MLQRKTKQQHKLHFYKKYRELEVNFFYMLLCHVRKEEVLRI